MWRSLLRLPPVAFVWGVVDTYNRLGVARAAAALAALAVALATGLGWMVIVLFQLTVFARERRAAGTADN